MAIDAYIDESGTHGGSRLLSVAACATGREHWESFGDLWSRQLRDANCDYFHAKDPKCNALRPFLVEAIRNQPIFASLVSVRPSDFKKHVGDKYRSLFGNAYATCVYFCALKIDKWSEQLGYESVSYVLETGQPNVRHVVKVLSAMIPRPEFRAVSVAEVAKRDFVQLQVSDFLSNARSTNDEVWLNRLRKALDETGQLDEEILGPEQLRQSSEAIQRIVLQERARRRHAKKGGNERALMHRTDDV